MRSLHAYVPAAVLLVGCAFVGHTRLQKAVPLAAPLNTILPQLPGYKVVDQTLSAEERRVAGMTSYVARAYVKDSVPAFTTFVSYYDRQTQGRTIHSPKNCLPGAGWEILNAGTAPIALQGREYTVNRTVLKNGGATAVVFYWYQGRGRIEANEYRVKWNLLRDAAIAGHTEEALVRVVVPVRAPSTDAERANPQLMVTEANAVGAEIANRLSSEVQRVLPHG